MSSLIVASDLDLMMLEISIDKLVVPRITEFDSAILKKTVVMFRLLDKDWTTVYPQRKDYQIYRGTNSDSEPFNGGVSVVFPIPQSSLDMEMDKIEIQLHVHRELSKYFEVQSSQNIGLACIDISDIFNGVINGLKNRQDHYLESRVPVAKSLKNTYPLLNENGSESGADVTVYLRLTHLGHSVISEINVPDNPNLLFYAREETSEKLPYQFREITKDQLTSGCWGSDTFLLPKDPRDIICCCDSSNRKKSVDTVRLYSESNDSKSKSTTSRDVGEDHNINKGGKKTVGKNNEESKEKKIISRKATGSEKLNKNNVLESVVADVTTAAVDNDEGTISCLIKPMLCGREGTCNKKDKKGKFGKCRKPDGEGGDPLACGEKRKCARRKMASGSATVGIVDKKISCPIPKNICPCSATIPTTCPIIPAWSPCATSSSTPCSRCRTVYYPSSYSPRAENLCHSYNNETTSKCLYGSNPATTGGYGQMHVGW